MIRIRADDVMAGDTIVVKEGRIRKFYHICEVAVIGRKVWIVYNGRQNQFVELRYRATQGVRIREDY